MTDDLRAYSWAGPQPHNQIPATPAECIALARSGFFGRGSYEDLAAIAAAGVPATSLLELIRDAVRLSVHESLEPVRQAFSGLRRDVKELQEAVAALELAASAHPRLRSA